MSVSLDTGKTRVFPRPVWGMVEGGEHAVWIASGILNPATANRNMKTRNRIQIRFSLATALAMLILAVGSAPAADRWWDGGTTDIGGNGNGASAGGAGTWDTTILNWDAGPSPHVAWINANSDTAVFGGTAGAVNIVAPIRVGGVTFSIAGYIFTGGTVEIAEGGIFKGTGNITYTFTNGFALAAGNTTYRFGNSSPATAFANANLFTVSGPLGGAGNSVVIAGGSSQPVYLTGTNTFGGTVTVSPGAAVGFTTANLDGMGGGPGIQSILVGDTGSVLRTGGSLNNAFLQRLVETTNTFTIYANNAGSGNALDLSGTNGGRYLPNASLATWDNAGTRTFSFTGTITPANNTYRFGGPRAVNFINLPNANTLTGARSLVVGGQSTVRVRIHNANNFTGETLVSAGTLFMLTNLVLQNSPINTAGGGVLDVSGDRQGMTPSTATPVPNPIIGGLIGNKDIRSVFSSAYTNWVTSLTLNPGAGMTNWYSGVIADGLPGMSLTKTGPGTQILSGTNTYTGTTTVSNGTLLINGSLAAASAVTVTTNGILGGTGTIGGSVQIAAGGLLSPGMGTNAGRLSVGQLSLQPGATVAIKLNGTNYGAYDQLVSAGDVNLGWGESALIITLGYTPVTGDQYSIFNLDPAATLEGYLAGLFPGDTIVAGGYRFRIQYWVGNGNDIALTCLGPDGTAPTISLVTPTNNATYAGYATIPLYASVVPNSAAITSVDFLTNGTVVATVSTPTDGTNYHANWTMARPGGPYVVVARANYGINSSVSATNSGILVNALVNPVVSGAQRNGSGGISFTLAGPEGQPWSLLSSINVALPLARWMVLTNGTFGASPVVYTDPTERDARRFYIVASPAITNAPLLSEDFEHGLGQWTVGSEGASGTAWELGTPANVGPAAAHSPTNCFGTNLRAVYGLNANIWLRSPVIDLTAAPGATLRFWQYINIEPIYDSGSVRILDASDNSELAVIAAVVDGTSAGWVQFSSALPAAAMGKQIKIEFRFRSDFDQSLAGWYIDDVALSVP